MKNMSAYVAVHLLFAVILYKKISDSSHAAKDNISKKELRYSEKDSFLLRILDYTAEMTRSAGHLFVMTSAGPQRYSKAKT